MEALEFSPENPELLTTVGLLYLRLGENYKAFDFLGNSLTHDPRGSGAKRPSTPSGGWRPIGPPGAPKARLAPTGAGAHPEPLASGARLVPL